MFGGRCCGAALMSAWRRCQATILRDGGICALAVGRTQGRPSPIDWQHLPEMSAKSSDWER